MAGGGCTVLNFFEVGLGYNYFLHPKIDILKCVRDYNFFLIIPNASFYVPKWWN